MPNHFPYAAGLRMRNYIASNSLYAAIGHRGRSIAAWALGRL